MSKLVNFLFLLILKGFISNIFGGEIPEKVLICGVAKNVAKDFYQNQKEIKNIASLFQDYRLIVYENNSTDDTKKLFSDWAEQDEKVIFLSEDLSKEELKIFAFDRIVAISRGRNIVLEKIKSAIFDDYQYVIILDLDDFHPFDETEIKNSILSPQEEWDAIFANGSYDLFALCSSDFPIRPELITWNNYANFLPYIGKKLALKLNNKKWLRVDSAFGGLAIYKRNAIINSSYSPYVTDEVFKLFSSFYNDNTEIYRKYTINSSDFFKNKNKIITCEHITFHGDRRCCVNQI